MGLPIRTAEDLGEKIRGQRRALGLDQAELARRAGVSRQWISEVENGKERAEIGSVLNTLAVLGIPLQVEMDMVAQVPMRNKPKRPKDPSRRVTAEPPAPTQPPRGSAILDHLATFRRERPSRWPKS